MAVVSCTLLAIVVFVTDLLITDYSSRGRKGRRSLSAAAG